MYYHYKNPNEGPIIIYEYIFAALKKLFSKEVFKSLLPSLIIDNIYIQ